MPCKILIVDDDDVFRAEFRKSLDGYGVVEASSGDEALKILKRPNEIDLVILDVKMPGEDGIAVLRKIKAITPELGVIILTGYSTEDTAIKSLRGRADDYIQKPCSIDRIKEVIERLLENKRRASGEWRDDTAGKIGRVREYLERNYFKRVTLTDAARLVSYSPKYLSRAFVGLTGKGFSEYRIAIQMEKAKELLAKSGCNVSEISDKLCYRNPESFIRQFKIYAGCTPTEYRRRQKSRST